MKSALVFLAVVALSQAEVSKPQILESKIINGEDAKLGERPYQVSLQSLYGSHFCGGVILNAKYVMTVALCVKGKPASTIQVVAGTINLDEPKSTHYAVEIIIHEKYSSSDSWINDIALIKVDVDFEVSKMIDFVPLPKAYLEVPADSVAVVSGWGRLWDGGMLPKKLKRADLVIADKNYCSKIYASIGNDIHDSHICAYDPVVETGACHGDAGGPLTVNGTLVGLVSWSNGCASRIYPTVYTKVSEFIDWIEAHAV